MDNNYIMIKVVSDAVLINNLLTNNPFSSQ